MGSLDNKDIIEAWQKLVNKYRGNQDYFILNDGTKVIPDEFFDDVAKGKDITTKTYKFMHGDVEYEYDSVQLTGALMIPTALTKIDATTGFPEIVYRSSDSRDPNIPILNEDCYYPDRYPPSWTDDRVSYGTQADHDDIFPLYNPFSKYMSLDEYIAQDAVISFICAEGGDTYEDPFPQDYEEGWKANLGAIKYINTIIEEYISERWNVFKEEWEEEHTYDAYRKIGGSHHEETRRGYIWGFFRKDEVSLKDKENIYGKDIQLLVDFDKAIDEAEQKEL